MFGLFKRGGGTEDIYCTAIIAAAGSSKRMGELGNKQFIEILGKPVLAYTVEAFESCRLINEIIIVTREEEIMHCSEAVVQPYGFSKVSKIIAGGSHRQESVYIGLKEIDPYTNIVVVHDGARPLVLVEDIENSIYECMDNGAAVIGTKVKETMKVVDPEGFIAGTPDRETLWAARTPQTFNYDLILKAHQMAAEEGFTAWDDAGLVERLGYKVKMIEGSHQNIKVTTVEDISIAESILENNLY